VDQSNLLEFFEAPVVPEPHSAINTSIISRVYFGRLKASKYFFRFPEAKKDRKLWDSLRTISNMYRGYLSHKLTMDKLQQELDQGNRKSAELLRQLDDLVSKSAFTYSCIENPRLNPNLIINGADAVTKEARDQIIMNCRLIKYIYCTDTVLDNNDQDCIDITNQSIEKLDQDFNAPSPRAASPRMDMSRTSTAKATPSKAMEAEKKA
jgi:hypothetical protein